MESFYIGTSIILTIFSVIITFIAVSFIVAYTKTKMFLKDILSHFEIMVDSSNWIIFKNKIEYIAKNKQEEKIYSCIWNGESYIVEYNDNESIKIYENEEK